MLDDIKKNLRARYLRWVDKRHSVSNTHSLNRRTLFIFPSKNGFWFLVVVGLLWLLGTNFENNLVLGLAFLLIALFVVSILHTFANLSGVHLQLLAPEDVFAGESAVIPVVVSHTGKRPRFNLRLRWRHAGSVAVDLIPGEEQTAATFVATEKRGRYSPGHLIIETFYPLGLFRCWAHLKVGVEVMVYPRPFDAGPLPNAEHVSDEGRASIRRGSDEFGGYKNYQQGDSLKNVAWKHYARGLDLVVKEFTACVDDSLWLDWELAPGRDRESRLSHLCHWVLAADRAKREFGLSLPGMELSPDTGPAHRQRALRALACFGAPPAAFVATEPEGAGMREAVA